MEKFDFEKMGFNVCVTPKQKGEFEIRISEKLESGSQVLNKFTLTGYQQEDDVNWDELIKGDPNREPFLEEVIAILDSE